MATTEENKRQVVLNFINFLVTETLQSAPDKKELVEAAVQSLESAFGIGSCEGRDPNIDALFQMGPQLAQLMEVNNPMFVENLRRQFSGDNPADPENPDAENQGGDGDKKDDPPAPSNGGGGTFA